MMGSLCVEKCDFRPPVSWPQGVAGRALRVEGGTIGRRKARRLIEQRVVATNPYSTTLDYVVCKSRRQRVFDHQLNRDSAIPFVTVQAIGKFRLVGKRIGVIEPDRIEALGAAL